MQGVSGTIVLGFMWFLTIDSSSSIYNVFDEALHTLGLSVPTFHNLLTKIITATTVLHTGWDHVSNAWDNLQNWTYTNFGIGSPEKKVTGESKASLYMHIKVDTKTYQNCAENLKDISSKLEQIKKQIDKVYYDAHSKKSILEATGEAIVEVLNLNYVQFPRAKTCVGYAAAGAEILADTLNRMASILEEAETSAAKYANLKWQ